MYITINILIMWLHNMWLSGEVTWWKPIEEVSTQRNNEAQRIILQLSWKTHFIESPEQALDLLHALTDDVSIRSDKEFIFGILYIIWEYLQWWKEYNINGEDNLWLAPDQVNIVRNRKWIISSQVLEVLNPSTSDIIISDINFNSLSQKIIEFLVWNATSEERRKIQRLWQILQESLNMDTNQKTTNWPNILKETQSKFWIPETKKEAA